MFNEIIAKYILYCVFIFLVAQISTHNYIYNIKLNKDTCHLEPLGLGRLVIKSEQATANVYNSLGS